MFFLLIKSKFTIKKIRGGGGGGRGNWGRGARVSDIFFYKESKSKKKFFFFFGGGVGGGGGVQGVSVSELFFTKNPNLK